MYDPTRLLSYRQAIDSALRGMEKTLQRFELRLTSKVDGNGCEFMSQCWAMKSKHEKTMRLMNISLEIMKS